MIMDCEVMEGILEGISAMEDLPASLIEQIIDGVAWDHEIVTG